MGYFLSRWDGDGGRESSTVCVDEATAHVGKGRAVLVNKNGVLICDSAPPVAFPLCCYVSA